MKKTMTTRKDFIAGALAGFACSGCRTWFGGGGRLCWHKGMLHCHTYWSDGRGFPEDAAAAYKALGYSFLAITDHNRLGTDPDMWRDVKPEDGPWPPSISRPVFDHYVRACSHARTRRTADGQEQVRLQPFAETRAMFEEPGRFLLMPGFEVTQLMPEGDRRDLHVNCVNLPDVLPSLAKAPIIARYGSASVGERLSANYAEYAAYVRAHDNVPSLFIVNHPVWPFLDVTAEDFLRHPEVRYFEVCNGGADFPAPDGLVDDGWYNDRLWDAVNAVRARRGEGLLLAVGSDDSHWYPGNGHGHPARTASTPGDAYVCVRTGELTPSALFSAMDRGDFYASCGVDPDVVDFDGERLTVSVPARPGVAHRIRFIVTKRDFSERPVRVVRVTSPLDKYGRVREIPESDPRIGLSAKVVEGRQDERTSASYALESDDLYVRARIESDEPAFISPCSHFHPKVRCAWTQPYAKTR